ncbi:unnamed protein product [Caenorhabditis brenneri]
MDGPWLPCPSFALHKAEGELVMKQALQCAIFKSERRERKIEELLEDRPPRPVYECPICFDNYDTEGGEKVPRVLRCGHTACELCIVGMLKESGGPRIFCPLCREACMVLDARDLPINWTLLSNL